MVQVNITPNGRMSLPIDIRKRLGLENGGSVIVEETETGVVSRTVSQAVARAQAIAKRYTEGNPDATVTAKVVLDASAVLASLKGERGGAKVAGVLTDAAIGAFNSAEVVSHFVRLGAPIEEVREMLGALPMRVVAADEASAWEAGASRASTAEAGSSSGDRFCLALAK
ncbi:hypothetical protein OY671_007547, partial [Metschnikowia pulcherrima]